MHSEKKIIVTETILQLSLLYMNILRHTVYTIASLHNPKQWLMLHTADLMMIIK